MAATAMRGGRALLVGALAISGCVRAQPGPAVARPDRDGAGAVAVILAGGRSCEAGYARDEKLFAAVHADTPALVTALRARGVTVPDPIDDPSKQDVERALAPAGGRPLIVIYSGHGRLAEPGGRILSDAETEARPHRPLRSVLCLKSGPVEIDQVVRWFRAPTPSALLVANACLSAHVDLRDVATDVSVISGSTETIAAYETTPIARQLTEVLGRPLDCDGDGTASDFEIFAPLERSFQRGGRNPDPKLKRQVRRAPALLSSARGECPIAAPALDGVGREYLVRGRRHLMFSGPAPAGASGPLPAYAFPVPCAEPVGQCFDVSARPPS